MKALNILKDTFKLSINNIVIDYDVHYDITGKVHEVNVLLFDLPESGQQLILGKNIKAKKQKIVDFKNLIPFILPLGIVNQEIFFCNELAPFHQSINQEITDNDIPKSKLYAYAKKDSLEHYILKSNLNPSAYPFHFNPLWDQLIILIKNRRDKVRLSNKRRIANSIVLLFDYHIIDNGEKKTNRMKHEYSQLAYKILPQVCSFLNENRYRLMAFNCLEKSNGYVSVSPWK